MRQKIRRPLVRFQKYKRKREKGVSRGVSQAHTGTECGRGSRCGWRSLDYREG